MSDFSELFSSYWWLLFPLGFFIAAGWGSFMRYKATQARIDLLKTYAASGKEPPADLLARLGAPDDDEDWIGEGSSGEDSGGTSAFLVMLFAGLSAVFGAAGYFNVFGERPEEFYFIAAILGVLSLAFLAGGLFKRRG